MLSYWDPDEDIIVVHDSDTYFNYSFSANVKIFEPYSFPMRTDYAANLFKEKLVFSINLTNCSLVKNDRRPTSEQCVLALAEKLKYYGINYNLVNECWLVAVSLEDAAMIRYYFKVGIHES